MRAGSLAVMASLLLGCGARAPGRPSAATPAPALSPATWPLFSAANLLPSLRPEPTHRTTPALAAGRDFLCALHPTGRVQCWGRSPQGQVGDGVADPRPRAPFEVPLERVTQVATGDGHACALLDGGEVRCWGSNQRGQLGAASHDDRPHGPTLVALPAPVRRLASPPLCALTEEGEVYCWGDAAPGRSGPVKLENAPTARDLSLGDQRMCALRPGGDLACWSADDDALHSPASGSFVQASLHGGSGCALDRGGRAVCWGALGTTEQPGDEPQPVRGLSDALQVRVGDGIGCARRSEGTVSCWGDLLNGGAWSWDLKQIAPHGGEASEVPGVAGAIDLALGRGFACALRHDGRVVCWGSNEGGISGTGQSDPPVIAPRVVPGVELALSAPERAGTP